MSDYDVVVVGAGLAGLETARRLGERGLRVLLADAKASVDRAVHTTGIFVRRTLEDFDLPEECLGPPVRRVVLYSPRGRALPLESPRTEYRVGRMGPLYLRMLEACVAAGVEWSPSTRFAGVLDAGERSVVLLSRGARGRAVRTRWIVGADGASSQVAHALALSENREWIVGVEEVFRFPSAEVPAFHCWLDPELAPGYLAWVVADGEEIHVGVGGYADRFRPSEALRRFRARWTSASGWRGAPRTSGAAGASPWAACCRASRRPAVFWWGMRPAPCRRSPRGGWTPASASPPWPRGSRRTSWRAEARPCSRRTRAARSGGASARGWRCGARCRPSPRPGWRSWGAPRSARRCCGRSRRTSSSAAAPSPTRARSAA